MTHWTTIPATEFLHFILAKWGVGKGWKSVVQGPSCCPWTVAWRSLGRSVGSRGRWWSVAGQDHRYPHKTACSASVRHPTPVSQLGKCFESSVKSGEVPTICVIYHIAMDTAFTSGLCHICCPWPWVVYGPTGGMRSRPVNQNTLHNHSLVLAALPSPLSCRPAWSLDPGPALRLPWP